MRIVKPITPTTTQLTSSSIAEPAAGEVEWVAGTAYSLGDEVIDTTTHRKYRSLVDGGNQGNDPQSENYDLNGTGANWQIVGSSLRYSMFDHTISTQSASSTPLSFSLTPGQVVSAVAGFNITGASSINVTMIFDGAEVYNTDVPVRDESSVDNYYDWFFEPLVITDRFVLLDLPAYAGGIITVTATGSGIVGIGEFVYGAQVDIGVTQSGVRWQGLDFSRKERNFDGTFSITQRRTADLVNYDFQYESSRFGYLRRQLQQVSSVATVFVGEAFGSEPDDGTVVFGYYKDVQLNITTPRVSFGTIQVEGLV